MSENESSYMQDYIKNISNLSNKVKDKVKENLTKIFKKENCSEINNTYNVATSNFSTVDESSSLHRSTFKKTGNENQENKKQVFTIEEDEEHKVYNYNLDTLEEEDDYDDYVEELDEDLSSPKFKRKLSDEKSKFKEDKTPEVQEQAKEKNDEIDLHTICHKLYTKGEIIDLEGRTYFKCLKKKENINAKIFSFIGLKKNEKSNLKEQKCVIFVEDDFMYFLKDKINPGERDKNNNFLYASKPYNLKTLSTVEVNILDSNKCNGYNIVQISLLFILDKSLDNYQSKIKTVYFSLEEYQRFNTYMRELINRLKVPVKI
jgi:hypothetical protein